MADIDAFVQTEAESLVAHLSEWCATPSISTDPAYAADVRRSAKYLARLMEEAGLRAEVVAVDVGQRAVYGECQGAGPLLAPALSGKRG